ncbi:MAG: diguanylate cyclase [Leptospiraceae bacterium]|nr:diguanylate cyclase [Leptospiraceae bacterium]MCP5513390.1 diguanylate cyclase [Leptospiraceae bacterium]
MKTLNFSKLSAQILKSVFLLYFSFTFLITLFYFGIEYRNAKESVLEELQTIEKTFSEALNQAIWELNQTQLEVIASGILRMAVIEGIEILDQDSKPFVKLSNTKNTISPESYLYKFQIYRTVSDSPTFLGSVILHSSPKIVFKRVQSGFLMIAFNSILKSTVLWYLLIFALNKYINNPLKKFTGEIGNIDLEHLDYQSSDIQRVSENELTLLQSKFREMTERLNEEKKKLIEAKETEKERLEILVLDRTSELQKANKELYLLANTDFLTGVLNRRMFWTSLEVIFENKFQGEDIHLIMMDIDHFKSINDKFGHQTGDLVLQNFASKIKKISRHTESIGRLGGEEFAIYLKGCSDKEVRELAEEIRSQISNLKIPISEKGNTELSFTVSIGISKTNSRIQSPEELMKDADRFLYLAKNNGRNRVEGGVSHA